MAVGVLPTGRTARPGAATLPSARGRRIPGRRAAVRDTANSPAAPDGKIGRPESVHPDMGRHLLLCLALAAGGGYQATRAAAAVPPDEATTLSVRPAPPAAATTRLMRRWRHDTRRRIGPVLREWQALAHAVRERPGRTLAAGCRRLGLALGRLDRDGLPVAPDPSVSLHLEQTLRSLSDAADSCAQGAYFLTVWRLRRADDSWRELRGRLLLYELAP